MDGSVLILGANGQVGRALRKVWPDATLLGRQALDLDCPRPRIINTIRHYRPTVVVNAAAWTRVDEAERPENFQAAMAVNGLAVAALAEGCREVGALLVQYSSDYVLADAGPGNPAKTPAAKTELHPGGPRSVYALSKWVGDSLAAECDSLIIRTSWAFGAGSNFIATILGEAKRRMAAAGGEMPETLRVVNDQIGRPTSAVDLARATRFLVEQTEHYPAIYNVQNGGRPVGWDQVARYALTVAELPVPVTGIRSSERSDPAQRPGNSVLDLTRLRDAGFDIPDWQAAVTAYIKGPDLPKR
jgi:dTDP-4-dehydrorhamnose reductase